MKILESKCGDNYMWWFEKGNTIFLIFIFLCLVSLPSLSAKELHFANEHWPPYIIMEGTHKASGIDVDIITEIANRLGVSVEIANCDWLYCLRMIENGRTDIISSALKHPEREKYMNYIEPPYIEKSTKLFYLRKGQAHKIKKYENIYQLNIGVLKGSLYFSPFDKDSNIQKVEVLKTEQLLPMLKMGRIDALIGTEIVIDYLIQLHSYEGLFDKSVFRYDLKTPFHFAISKKSYFSKEIDKFNSILKSLIKEGFVQEIIDKYNKKPH